MENGKGDLEKNNKVSYGIWKTKDGRLHIPDKETVLNNCYLALLPKSFINRDLEILPHKRLSDDADIYCVISINIYYEAHDSIGYSYVPLDYFHNNNINLEEAWKRAAANTIRLSQPKVFPLFFFNRDMSISEKDQYKIEAQSVPYNAAGCIAIPGFLKAVSEHLGHSLWILPQNNSDLCIRMEGKEYPCSFSTVKSLTNEVKALNANGIPDRVLPDDEILHFDMDSGKLESGKKYVEKKLGINDEYDFESVFDRKIFSI